MSDKKFPTYTSNRRTSDKGVTFIRSVVENEFDWIFRPTHLEDDFGLDGYFDVIRQDNSVTGKYLGVQIKTGESFFKQRKKTGWIYNGENKHLNYYLNSNFPILIIITNIENGKAYWVEFDIDKTSKTKNGWSIIIPESNILNKESKELFENMVGDSIDYMSQIEYQWEMSEQMRSSDLIYLYVSKNSVVQKDISGFTTLLKRLTIDDEMIALGRGKISFFVDGYNSDPRELFQIPEVIEWAKILIPEFKYWAYFINMVDPIHPLTGLNILHFCSVDLENTKFDIQNKTFDVSPNPEQSLKFLEQLWLWLNEFTDKYSISEEINKEQSNLAMKAIFGKDFYSKLNNIA